MKRFELILISILLLGIILFVFGLSVSPILIIGFTTLIIFYFIGGIILFNELKLSDFQNIDGKQIVLSITASLFLPMALIGIMYKLISLPQEINFLINMAIIGLSGISIFSYIQSKKSDKKTYLNILKRSIPILILTVIFHLSPYSFFLEIKYQNHPELVEAILEAKAHPNNPDLWKK